MNIFFILAYSIISSGFFNELSGNSSGMIFLKLYEVINTLSDMMLSMIVFGFQSDVYYMLSKKKG